MFLFDSLIYRTQSLVKSKCVVFAIAFSFLVSTTSVLAQSTYIAVPVVETRETQRVWKGRPIDNPLYDLSIKKWNSFYNPEIPWYWAKAQLLAESALDPNAVSPVGAKGLGQFMPLTWKDMQRELGFNGSEYTPTLSIQAHAYYMKKLRAQFKAPRPEKDRHSLALASYNAGLGNVLKAQKKGGGSVLYAPMIQALPAITGEKNSRETTLYVQRIWKYTDHYKLMYEPLE